MDRPDLLLGIIVTHVAKQQQQQQQHVAGKGAGKTWMYGERQERTIPESVNVQTTPTISSTPSTVIRETETIASPANQVTVVILSLVKHE